MTDLDSSISRALQLWPASRPTFYTACFASAAHTRVAHRVLLIPELVSCILEHADNRSLARFARTCKGFLVPALKVLYSSMSVRDLRLVADITVFAPLYEPGFADNDDPADIRREKARKFLHELDPLGRWRRFLTYTSLVRELDDMRYTSADRDDFEEALPRIFQLSPVPFILPHLRRIRWRVTSPRHIACIVPLLAPTLQTLELLYTRPERDEASFQLDDVAHMKYVLQLLPTKCPALRKLLLDSPDMTYQSTTADCLALILARLKHLKCVACGTIAVRSPVLQVLVQKSDLDELRIESCWGLRKIEEMPLDVFYGSCRFSSLRSLSIRGLKTRTVLKLLELFSAGLESLRITVRSKDTFAECTLLERLSSTIGQQFSNVKDLTINLNEDEDYIPTSDSAGPSDGSPDGVVLRIYWTTFKPLTTCRRIRNFTLMYDFALAVYISDADILQIAKSWSELEQLTFGGNDEDVEEEDNEFPGTTMTSLVALSNSCPRLRQIELDSLRIDPIPDLSSIIPRTNPIILEVVTGPISDIATASLDAFAIALFRLWPNIEFGEATADEWETLRDKITLLKAYDAVQQRKRQIV